MWKKIARIFKFGFVLAVGSIFANGQTKTPKTMREYFKLIPSEYFSVFCCEENKKAFIKKYVTAEDDKNGFIEGDDTEEDPQYQGFR